MIMACSICTEPFFRRDEGNSHIVATKCGHVFHYGCICDWLATELSRMFRACPECRKELGYEPFLRLYLNNADPDEALAHKLQEPIDKNTENEELIKQLTESGCVPSRSNDDDVLKRLEKKLEKIQISLDEMKTGQSSQGSTQASSSNNNTSGGTTLVSNPGNQAQSTPNSVRVSGLAIIRPQNIPNSGQHRGQDQEQAFEGTPNSGNRNQSQNSSNRGRNWREGRRNRRGNRGRNQEHQDSFISNVFHEPSPDFVYNDYFISVVDNSSDFEY